MNNYIQIYWTAANMEEAKEISSLLVQMHLVACANIIPSVESIFLWKGKIDSCVETKVIFKTRDDQFDEVKKIILENCKYEIPEILKVQIVDGNKDYLAWIDECILKS